MYIAITIVIVIILASIMLTFRTATKQWQLLNEREYPQWVIDRWKYSRKKLIKGNHCLYRITEMNVGGGNNAITIMTMEQRLRKRFWK